MTEIIFRTLTVDDIPAVNVFYNNYHKANRTAEKFRWEFMQGPHGKGIYCLALMAETGRIIGIQGGVLIEMLLADGKKVLTIKSEDTLVDTAFCAEMKIKKVFRDLYAFFVTCCREQGAVSIWGFTWATASFDRIGFQIPFDAGQALMVIHPFKSFKNLSGLNAKNNLFSKLKISMLVATSWTLGWQSRCFRTMDGLTMDEGIRSNEELFTELVKTNHDLVFMKQDEAFLTWRLKDNPYALEYSVLNVSLKGQFIAQVITSIHPNGQGFVEQFLATPEVSLKIRKKILKAAVNHLSEKGAIHIRVLTFAGNTVNRQEVNLLKSSGFFLLNKGMGFVFLPLNEPPAPAPGQYLLSRIYTQGHV